MQLGICIEVQTNVKEAEQNNDARVSTYKVVFSVVS